jgi:hypothetical protein
METATTPTRRTHRRPSRWFALLSLFSLLAFVTGDHWQLFCLAFLVFLIPERAKKRIET